MHEPKTDGQRRYLDAIREHDLVFCLGPAGSGKTFLACVEGVRSVTAEEFASLVIVRPAVEAGERCGHLPGDVNEKMAPYVACLREAIDKSQADVRNMARRVRPDVQSLGFARGKTWENAFVILDEAQNATARQMKLFMTRLGHGSKMVICGDPTQVDIPDRFSGLMDAVGRLKGKHPRIAVVELDKVDIVRHPLVSVVVEAYS